MRLEDIWRLLQPLSVRLANVVGRGVLKKADDSKKMQTIQAELLAGEVRSDVEHWHPYGFTSVPREGAEVVVLFPGGSRDQGLAIVTGDRRYRLTNLQSGEVALHNDTGARIVMKANGDIELVPKSGQKVKVASPAEFSGDVTVTGTLTASTDVVGGGKHLATHKHSVEGSNSGGPVVFVPPTLVPPALTGGPT